MQFCETFLVNGDGTLRELSHLIKKRLLHHINEISFGTYLLVQNRPEWYPDRSKEDTEKDHKHTRKWLQIEESHLKMGDEIDYKWDNGEKSILDTDLDYDNNEAVYSV